VGVYQKNNTLLVVQLLPIMPLLRKPVLKCLPAVGTQLTQQLQPVLH
jgi:hypothetical protein